MTHIDANPHIRTPDMSAAAELVASLPRGDYTDYYQPAYPDNQALVEAVHELQSTETVTTPRNVDALQHELTALAEGRIQRPIIITGRCAEEVDIKTPVSELVEEYQASQRLVLNAVAGAVSIIRGMGQNAKPRSNEFQLTANGRRVPSYMGDAINSFAANRRKPDPSRMVAAALQARDVADGLEAATGNHVVAAHEALLLAYEKSFVHEDPETGKQYLLSADMPWIGKRTNNLDGPHVALLAGVENPVGIKIGSDSDEAHIAGLQARLNPEDRAGKLIFMVRMGIHEGKALNRVLSAIAKHAPQALVMYDVHGTTRVTNGHKIRCVPDIIKNIKATAAACKKVGLKLHGLHLETTMEENRLECTDMPGEAPGHVSAVDPLLSPQQTERILQAVAGDLL